MTGARSLNTPSVITIGNFDGVHAGHRALLQHCRTMLAGSTGRVVAVTFDPDPREVLQRSTPPPDRLTTRPQRESLLMGAGADHVEWLHVTPALLELTPSEFLRPLIQRLNVRGIVEGPDFRFGRRREGDVRALREIAGSLGVAVEIVDPVEVALNDHHVVPARSTIIRWLLAQGRVADAAIVLARPYAIQGTVVRGDRRGRTIGYPTANIRSTQQIPADGVYAGRATLPDGRIMPAAISVGTKPTFGPHERALEAFLIELAPDATVPTPRTDLRKPHWKPIDGLPEYEWSIGLEFVDFLRDQVRFDGLSSLLDQMNRDCRAALNIFSAAPHERALPAEALA